MHPILQKPRPARRALTAAALTAGALSVSALSLGACATRPPATDKDATADFDQTNDPLEPTNRFFYRVNDTLDTYTLKPLAQGYIAVVPAPARTGIHNVLANLNSPVLFADDVSQANPRHAGDTFARFVINSTIGVAGLVDVAKDLGLPGHDTNFGITLALWGVPAGPYLYLPLIGPSSPRAVLGRGADTVLDPFTWVPHGYGLITLNWARYGVGVVDERAEYMSDLEHVKASALDPYATFRSLYRQNIASQVEAARHPAPPAPPAGSAQPSQ
jgi:phospholipid-binding lipoprotein MlaA